MIGGKNPIRIGLRNTLARPAFLAKGLDFVAGPQGTDGGDFPLITFQDILDLSIFEPEDLDRVVPQVRARPGAIVSVLCNEEELTRSYRMVAAELKRADLKNPILLLARYNSIEEALYQTSIHFGALLLDGIGDAVAVGLKHADPSDGEPLLDLMLDLLQATRLRLSKTEFISCPSCGRTLFDLQETTARIQKRTGHLKGVKIAIMGCVVNGPGEMADADFGYVGAGPGKIHLYRGKELVKKSIPSEIADEELVKLIQEDGMWVDPQA
ncbi:MAG: flavodoxin-dependent (E)-4-hydroxy-3-methylbut-2-enyl-diphosphate synthase [Leptospirales bacterium]|nr:flavodoxin-dependent (E)-4-hydroxy-3-methylbut-2-enyl-diphosphate synthase [Leptospirales bacterium]